MSSKKAKNHSGSTPGLQSRGAAITCSYTTPSPDSNGPDILEDVSTDSHASYSPPSSRNLSPVPVEPNSKTGKEEGRQDKHSKDNKRKRRSRSRSPSESQSHRKKRRHNETSRDKYENKRKRKSRSRSPSESQSHRKKRRHYEAPRDKDKNKRSSSRKNKKRPTKPKEVPKSYRSPTPEHGSRHTRESRPAYDDISSASSPAYTHRPRESPQWHPEPYRGYGRSLSPDYHRYPARPRSPEGYRRYPLSTRHRRKRTPSPCRQKYNSVFPSRRQGRRSPSPSTRRRGSPLLPSRRGRPVYNSPYTRGQRKQTSSSDYDCQPRSWSNTRSRSPQRSQSRHRSRSHIELLRKSDNSLEKTKKPSLEHKDKNSEGISRSHTSLDRVASLFTPTEREEKKPSISSVSGGSSPAFPRAQKPQTTATPTHTLNWGGNDNERPQIERPTSQVEDICSTHHPNPPTPDQNETEHSSHKSDVAIEPVNPAIVHKVFKEQRPRLMIAISSSLRLVNELYSADVISAPVCNKLSVIGMAKDEINMILLNAVEDKIQTDPAAFMTFVSALQSEPALKEMARQLLHCYRQMIVAVNQGTTTTCCGPIARYANYLKAYYDTSPISQAYKWPLTPSTQYINLAIIKSEPVSREQADEFTRLTLHGDIDQVLHKKKDIEITDILKPKDDEKLRFVLVEGAPGVGKSTIAWELCKRWDKMEALKQYSLVVLLKLRDEGVQNATRLEDFFYHGDTDLQEAVVKEVMAREGEGVLLIMDGADECPQSFWKDKSLSFRILSGHLLPKATVLVTTRPSASTMLISKWKPQKRIEVLGFTSHQIYQYTEHILGSEPHILRGFHKYISSSPSIRGLLYIPLNTVIAVGVYRENRKKGKPIPTTLTQLYTDLALTLLQRYLLDSKLVEDASALPQTIYDLPESVRQQFLDLAEVAYEGTIGQRLVFQNLPEGSKPLGFTTTSAELHTGRRLSYNFLHLTIQEYLAAFYFSQLPTDQQQATYLCHQILLKHLSTSHLNVMWTFVAGLTHFKNVGLETIRSEMLEEHGGPIKVNTSLLPLLYEMQEEESIQAVLGSGEVSYSKSMYTVPQVSPFQYFSLGYCIAHSKCTWTLDLCVSSNEQVEMFLLGVESQFQASSCIHSLDLNNSFLQGSIEHFGKLPLSGIHNLNLGWCFLDVESFHTIIPGMDNLESLDISGNCLVGPGDMVELLQALSKIKSLLTLNLSFINLDCDDIGALAPLVAPQGGSLRELIIGGDCATLLVSREMEAAAVMKMLTMLFAESSLQSLSLHCIYLQLSTNHFAELLEKNPNLQTLELSGCGPKLATVCVKALCKNTILKTFSTDKVGEDGANVLSEVLRVNQSLKELNIYEYPVTDRPTCIESSIAKVLTDALQHNQTLQKITLPFKFKFRTDDPRIVFNKNPDFNFDSD